MSRPQKPEDPSKWPPCARCHKHHKPAATWPEGRVCGYCYKAAQRVEGTCACGHTGVLPGIIEASPACRSCSRIRLSVDCGGCGSETELYSGGRCWACVLAATVDRVLTNPVTGEIAPTLRPVAAALKSMTRANSGMTWIRQPHVNAFLTDLAVAPDISHASLDRLPASRTRDYVRGLLVEHGALPRRDERLARYTAWAEDALTRLSDGEDRDVIRRYVRWHHLRRMNQMHDVTQGTFLRSKQTVTVAIELLLWLREQDRCLNALTQADLDLWQASGLSTRELASRFLAWAIKTNLVDRDLTMTPHRRGTSPRASADEQEQALHRVVHTDELTPRDRFAAILVLVFGQQIERVVRLTWSDVSITEDLVTVTLGRTSIALPDPLDGPLRRLDAEPRQGLTAAHPATAWIFRGLSPGQHVSAAYLRHRIKEIIAVRSARLGTLHELTKLAPTAIIADVLGYSPQTIERHAAASASTYAQYVAARHHG
jgi:hypothetical protein